MGESIKNKKNSYSSYLYSKTIIMVYNCNSNIYFLIFNDIEETRNLTRDQQKARISANSRRLRAIEIQNALIMMNQ